VEELALPRDQILLVGDTLHDLEVARELGLDCVLIAAGHHPAARLRAKHDRVVDNLTALRAELAFPST
jgi:phosphoglycolate phosphatase